MIRYFILFMVLASSMFIQAQRVTDCKEWKISTPIQLRLPVFAEKGSVDGKVFDLAKLLKNTKVNDASAGSSIKQDDSFTIPWVSSKNQLVN